MKHRQWTTARHRLGIALHRWHRRVGVAASVFLIWLAASGIVLNESASLHLDSQRIAWPWLMHWYGLQNDVPTHGYRCDNHWIVFGEDSTLLDGQPITPAIRTLRGAVAIDGILYLATLDSIIMLQANGSRIDTLNTLPIKLIKRIGSAGHQLVIANQKAYASADGDQWRAIGPDAVTWSQAETLPPPIRAGIAKQVRPSLPLLRIMADAHSGRLFGAYGTVLIDAAAVAAMLLALSGIWMVLRDASRRRQRPRQR